MHAALTRTLWTLVALALCGPAILEARLLPLSRETEAGWSAYIRAIEERRAREGRQHSRFLALDFLRSAADERRRLAAGEIVVMPVERGGMPILPGAAVHHWRGAVFVAGTNVSAIVRDLQAGPPLRTDEVLAAQVLERRPGFQRVFLKLQRRRIVTATYHTEHTVSFHQHGPGQAESTSVATRIAELAAVGTPDERERRIEEDRGFLWRLNAYWRYATAPGGVIVECESVSLSRSVPRLIRPIAGPVVEGVARESMATALGAVRRALGS
jgi:hypothetical protein